MGRVILQFFPLMIAGAVTPVWIFITLLLLRGHGGFPKAIAFASGQTLVRLAQGIAFLYASESINVTHLRERTPTVVDTLFLVAGVLLWITALKLWSKEEDPDAPPPKWLAMLDSISTPKTFAFSLLLMAISAKQWIFTFAALCVIRESDLNELHSVIAFLVFALGAQSLVLTPIVTYALAPRQAPRLVEAGIQWLERHNQTIKIVISVLLGTYFVFKGIMGLRD